MTLTARTKAARLDLHPDPWRCYWCRVRLFKTKREGGFVLRRTADHLIPVARGGTWAPENLVPSCWICNTARGDLDAGHWRAWLDETEDGRHFRDRTRERRIGAARNAAAFYALSKGFGR